MFHDDTHAPSEFAGVGEWFALDDEGLVEEEVGGVFDAVHVCDLLDQAVAGVEFQYWFIAALVVLLDF